MNTLTTPLLPTAAVTRSPDPAVATLLAVALEIPGGGLDYRIDLAAVALRLAGERYTFVGNFHCVLHAGMSAALIAEYCRLPLDQVRDRTPAAVALTALERYLTAPPYVLVSHQATDLDAVIARHAQACPALNAAQLLDTAALARSVLHERCPRELHALTAHLGVSATPRPAHTAADAALTGALYAHLHRVGHGRAQVNVDVRRAREVRRGQGA